MSVVRVFRCRPRELDFDAVVRDILLPDLLDRPGAMAAVVGRRGPDQIGERAIVSLWTDREAMVAAMGEHISASRFHPEFLDATTEHRLDVHPVVVDLTGPDTEPTILRIAEGRLAGSGIHAYAEGFRAGVSESTGVGTGPNRILLADACEPAFLSVSWWPDWASIEAATGATIDQPVRTRDQSGLAAFEALHYEILAVGRAGG